MKIESEDIPIRGERKGVTGGTDREASKPPPESDLRRAAERLQTVVRTLRTDSPAKSDRLRLSAEAVDLYEGILSAPTVDAEDFEIQLRHAVHDGAMGLEAPPGTADKLVANFRRLLAAPVSVGH